MFWKTCYFIFVSKFQQEHCDDRLLDLAGDSPLWALPSSTDACRGSAGFQSASKGLLRLPSSDGAFCSPGLFCPSSGWSRPPRLPSSIWLWSWPCQAMLDFHSPSPCERIPIPPPPRRPSSCIPVPLEHSTPRLSPSDGWRPLRSSVWLSQAGFTLKSDSKGSWVHGLLPLLTPPAPTPPTPALTGSVCPFFT